jgi:hypothetical protein
MKEILAGAVREMVTEAEDLINEAQSSPATSPYSRAVFDTQTGRWRLVDPSGYARLYPEQPSPRNWLRYDYEHRKVMEEKLQRQLAITEIIHHLDGNRSNNIPENLELVADHIAHMQGEHPDWRRGLTGREKMAGLMDWVPISWAGKGNQEAIKHDASAFIGKSPDPALSTFHRGMLEKQLPPHLKPIVTTPTVSRAISPYEEALVKLNEPFNLQYLAKRHFPRAAAVTEDVLPEVLKHLLKIGSSVFEDINRQKRRNSQLIQSTIQKEDDLPHETSMSDIGYGLLPYSDETIAQIARILSK